MHLQTQPNQAANYVYTDGFQSSEFPKDVLTLSPPHLTQN